jgi:hypothetical protein
VVYGLHWWDQRVHDKNLSLDALFERTYARELTLGDEAHDLRALWASVRDRAQRALTARGNFPVNKRSELRRLDKVIDKEIPELRALASKAREDAPAAEPPESAPPAAEPPESAPPAAESPEAEPPGATPVSA